MYKIKTNSGRLQYPLIVQHTRSIFRKKFHGVIRCLAVGENPDGRFIAFGSQDKNLYIVNSHLDILQNITFNQWVRCLTVADISNDGISEIITGGGDGFLRIYAYIEDHYEEILAYPFNGFVSACSVADVTGDGELEIIAGSWDNTIRVFKFIDKKLQLIWMKTFENRIKNISIADQNWDSKLEIIITFQGGGIDVLSGKDGISIWQYSTEKNINGSIGTFVDGTGYPYMIIGGDDQILHFFNIQGNVVKSMKFEDRITSINTVDIDGDGIKELIVGVGQNTLNVYELTSPELDSLDLRWSIRTYGVINDFEFCDINGDGRKELIYGGYDCYLTAIQDNFYGEIPEFQIEPKPFIDKDCAKNLPSISQEEIEFLISSENNEFAKEYRGIEEGLDEKAKNCGDPEDVIVDIQKVGKSDDVNDDIEDIQKLNAEPDLGEEISQTLKKITQDKLDEN